MCLPVRLIRNGLRSVSGEGETVNLGSGGVLFTCSIRVEVGDAVEYTIGLAPQESSTNVTLHCLGKVTRSRPRPATSPERPFEVAATLERYEFIRNHS